MIQKREERYGCKMKRFHSVMIFCMVAMLLTAIPAQAADTPYLEKVEAGQPIFEGPGYACDYAGEVSEDGTYTIVEEERDDSGNLWGRLKSGAGWIDLTNVRGEEAANSAPLISVAKAGWAFLEDGSYHEYIHEESDATVRLAFSADQTVENVQFVSFELSEAGMKVDRVLYSMEELYPGKPLVTAVVFYGDMTAYGLICTDGSGQQRCYMVSVSGYDGSLIVNECELVAVPF